MVFEGLSDLKTDPEKGIEGSGRILRDKSDLVAADLFDLLGVLFEDILAFKEDLSRDNPASDTRV